MNESAFSNSDILIYMSPHGIQGRTPRLWTLCMVMQDMQESARQWTRRKKYVRFESKANHYNLEIVLTFIFRE
jgi:hypothetical protein